MIPDPAYLRDLPVPTQEDMQRALDRSRQQFGHLMKPSLPVTHAYAGIGTREVTEAEQAAIIRTAGLLADQGWICYSGNASGTDQAFQRGSNGRCVLWLPWPRFEEVSYPHDQALAAVVCGDSPAGLHFTQMCHPAWDRLSRGGLALINRDAHQVIGNSTNDPTMRLQGVPFYPMVSFVLCCATPKGKQGDVQGGTGQAVRIARCLKIPVVNIRELCWPIMLSQALDPAAKEP